MKKNYNPLLPTSRYLFPSKWWNPSNIYQHHNHEKDYPGELYEKDFLDFDYFWQEKDCYKII